MEKGDDVELRRSYPEVLLGKVILKIYRRAPMRKCDFNKVTF